jgi:hypothetical protein
VVTARRAVRPGGTREGGAPAEPSARGDDSLDAQRDTQISGHTALAR